MDNDTGKKNSAPPIGDGCLMFGMCFFVEAKNETFPPKKILVALGLLEHVGYSVQLVELIHWNSHDSQDYLPALLRLEVGGCGHEFQ